MHSSFSTHKNLYLSVIVALVIMSIGFWVNKNDEGELVLTPQDIPSVTRLAMSTSTNITDRDSDADGLPDWEEHLYGSDPFTFDSDGDGTPDGEEVKEGRDPSKKNTNSRGDTPNDSLGLIQDPHFATSSTDILGIKKEFFSKFLTEQSQQIRQATYKELIKSFDAKKVAVRNQIVDLNVSSDNSPEALRAYGNAFGLIINTYTKRSHRTESEIVADALKASSTQILRELQLPAIDYKNFSQDLKTLKTPTSMANFHLSIVNGYEQMGKGLLLMQELFTNPVNGAGGYEAYTQGKFNVTDGYARIVANFDNEHVVFTRSEAGSPFTLPPATAQTTSNIQ